MKKIFSFLFVFIFSSSFVFSNPKEEVLVVGTASGYAPFVSLNEKGEYEGFDIDFAKELAKKMNRKLVLKDLGSMNSLMLALNQNKIDAVIWAISITQERKDHLNMIYYQGGCQTKYPIIFWNEVPKSFLNNIENLCNNSKDYICVEAGSSQENILKCYPKVNIRYIEKITDGIMDVKYGKSKATLCDESLLKTLTGQHPEIIVRFLDLPPSERIYGNGIAVKKSNVKLAKEIQTAVDMLKADKIIQKLEKKWNLVGE